jgi:hypothetical protein
MSISILSATAAIDSLGASADDSISHPRWGGISVYTIPHWRGNAVKISSNGEEKD